MEIHSAPFQKLKSATFCYMVALKNEKNGKKKKRKNVRCTAKGKLFNVRAERVWKKKKKKIWRDTRQYFRQLFYESKYENKEISNRLKIRKSECSICICLHMENGKSLQIRLLFSNYLI